MIEKRQTPRIETDLKFISCSSGISTDAHITNMSTSGAFIETSEPLPINAELDLHFQLPDDSDIMSIDAHVVRIKSVCCATSTGMDIQFTNILPRHQEKLTAFIEQNCQENSCWELATVYVCGQCLKSGTVGEQAEHGLHPTPDRAFLSANSFSDGHHPKTPADYYYDWQECRCGCHW